MELLTYYRKVASKFGWYYVMTHFIKLDRELEAIKFLSHKFNVGYLYEKWIQHTHISSYSHAVSIVAEYDRGRGQNYQVLLKKLFGAM